MIMKKKKKDIFIERLQFAIQNDDLMVKLIKELEKPDDEEIPMKKKRNNQDSQRPKELN